MTKIPGVLYRKLGEGWRVQTARKTYKGLTKGHVVRQAVEADGINVVYDNMSNRDPQTYLKGA